MINYSKVRASFFVFLFWAVIPLAAHASTVPELVHYEGFLSNANGFAVADGNYTITFRLYDSFNGGTALWTENWGDSTSLVPVVNGRFRILLGSHDPLTSALFQQHPNTFLGITVGSDNEMTPRQRIASVPYALSSPGSSIPAGVITMWSGAINDIPSGWALCDGTNGTPDLRDRFVVGAGTTYSVGNNGGEKSNNISHTHSIAAQAPGTNSTGTHSHHIRTNLYSGIGDTSDGAEDGSKNVGSESHGHDLNVDTWSAGAHSHTVNSHNHSGATGTSGSTTLENRPPYYALALIMKM